MFPRVIIEPGSDHEKAQDLLVDALLELYKLKEGMKFNDVQEDTRRIWGSDGSRITCQSVFGLDTLYIFAPPDDAIELELPCFCSCCFAVGIVSRIIEDYGYTGPFYYRGLHPYFVYPFPVNTWPQNSRPSSIGEYYPDYCSDPDEDIQRYGGIRYEVLVCQGDFYAPYICSPLDFTEFEVGNFVMVLFRGRWDGEDLLSTRCASLTEPYFDEACFANRHQNLTQAGDRRDNPNVVDGNFVITQISTPGLTTIEAES